MSKATVRSQSELDTALADPAVTAITVDAPADVPITITASASKYLTIKGGTSVEYVDGSARVGSVGGSARVEYVDGSARVESVYGSASVESVGGSARVGSVGGSARVGSVGGSARVGSVYGSARVGSVDGSARVGSVYGSARVGYVDGSARVGSVDGSARVESVYGSASVESVGGSARVEARGTSSVHAYGGTIQAGPHVAVFKRSRDAVITGGVIIDCTVPNVDLMQRTLAQIDAHPELWDQSTWVTETSCGTAYDFAGWAAVLSGAGTVTTGNARSIAESELLITRGDANALFAGSNTREDLARIVDRISAEAVDPAAVQS